MERENAIRAAVALKAAVKYWQGANASHAQVLESATLFFEWLGEREGVPVPVDVAHPSPAPSLPPQNDPSWGCPVCGTAPMKLRTGRNGEFYGCKRYPDCKGTRERDGSSSLKSPVRS